MTNKFITECDGIIIKLFNNLIDNLVKEIHSSNNIDKNDPSGELKRLDIINKIAVKEQYLYNLGKPFGLSREFLTRECLIRLAAEYNKMFTDNIINEKINNIRTPENIIEYFCTRYKNASMNNIKIIKK